MSELTFHVQPDAWLPVAELLTMFHPQNSQTRNRAEMDAIKRHLQDEGFTAEMIVVNPWNRKIVSGHGRTQAAHELGFAGSLPVVYREYKSEPEHRRAMLRWNLARGHQDEAKEAAEFAALLADFDRADLAADFALEDGEFEALLREFGQGGAAQEDPGPQTDRAAELREKWQTEPGQLWQLGEHRLICGDCRESSTWERLLAGEKVNGVFTSPPYAMQRKEQYGGVPTDEYVEWWEAVQGNVKANLATDGSFFVNIKPHCEDGQRVLYVADLVLAMVRRWGWMFRDEFIWKHAGFPGKFLYRHRNQFEPIFHFSLEHIIRHFPLAVGKLSDAIRDNRGGKRRGGARMAANNADNDPDAGRRLPTKSGVAQVGNVIECYPDSGSLGHKAVFPVALPDFFIRAYSDTGDLWLDPFCGSGTTIVAAEQNQRRGFGIEMLPKYCAVILERWSGLTSQTPALLP